MRPLKQMVSGPLEAEYTPALDRHNVKLALLQGA